MAPGIFGIPINTLVILGGIGYLVYAHKNKLPPFNAGGFLDPNKGKLGEAPAPMAPADITPMPKPNELPGSPPDNVSGNPFTGGKADIDMGMGNRMPDPTPLGTISPQERAQMPFGSSVQSDPTPTDYGIYTQYMNGLRNEYQKMENDRRTAAAGDIGIGGDITTLPQPPTVGATPFNFPGPGMQGMGPPPPPTWAAFPPPYSQMPPMPPGYFPPPVFFPQPIVFQPIEKPIKLPRTGIRVGPIYIGPDGIRIGNAIVIGPGKIRVGDSIKINRDHIKVGNKIKIDNHGRVKDSKTNNVVSQVGGDFNFSGQKLDFGGINTPAGTGFDMGGINDMIKNMFGNFGSFYTNPANTTFVEKDDGDFVPTVPSDIDTINPTLFNAVSRNQPGGMMYDKIGNY